MYHLKLIKALSYTGAISATREKPDAYTDDEAIAQAAVASGYFRLVSGETATEDDPANQFTGDPEPGSEGGENGSGKTLEEMNASELETFATYKGVSLKGIKGKANIIAKLREELGEEATSGPIEYGSPTMTELQQQE